MFLFFFLVVVTHKNWTVLTVTMIFAQHFLQLQFFKKQFEAVENATDRGNDVTENIGEVEGTVFDEAVALLQRLEKELIDEVSDAVALDVKAKSRAYRTDKYEALSRTDKILKSARSMM